jgi:hypothetical protein
MSSVNRDRLDRLYRNYYKNEYAGYSNKPKIASMDAFTSNDFNGNLDEKATTLLILENASKSVEELGSLYGNLSEASTDKTLKKFFSGLANEKTKNVQIMRTQSAYIEGTGCYTENK